MRIWLAAAVLAMPLAARAQGTAVQEQPERVSIQARVVDYTPPHIHAVGNVLFQQGLRRLSADEVIYDSRDSSGVLTRATFTTCDLPHPDYHVSAREIRLTPRQKLKLRGVRIYLGNFRVISLPALSIDVGPRAARQTLIPRPGINSQDGLFLMTRYSLAASEKTDVDLLMRPTSKAGIQGGLAGGFAVRGSARLAPAYVPETDLELRRQSVLQPSVADDSCAFPQIEPQPPLLAVFGAALLRERAFDINSPNLYVTRLPEIGAHYVSRPVCVIDEQPTVGLQTEARASWGRFKETTDNIFRERWDVRGIASTTLAILGRSTALRGSGLARYSAYGAGGSYRVLGAALDVSRIFSGGSFASIRLIGHAAFGATPFEFDNVDIKKELQGAARYVRRRNTYGILLRYDLEKHSLPDMEFSIARRLHCLEPAIIWRKRFGQISFNIRVLGL